MKLIVIDMQKALMDDELYDLYGLIGNITKIIEAARENAVEVIYVQHDAGPGTGFSVGDEAFEIADEVAPREGEKVFVKTINSCFVKSAFERGYDVILPEGTNSTFDNPYMTGKITCEYYMNEVWPDLFADCVSMDEALELIQKKDA